MSTYFRGLFRGGKVNCSGSVPIRDQATAMVAGACCVLGGVSGAGAQCSTPDWLAGGVRSGLTGSLRTTALWDPDGAGPQQPMLLAGGTFTIAGSTETNLAAWNGSAWVGFAGGANDEVWSLVTAPDGSLLVGGRFTQVGGTTTANRMARWNGTTWSTFGDGLSDVVFSVAVLTDGTIVAGGFFNAAIGTTPAINRLARWDGTQWSGFDAFGADGQINTILALPGGEMIVGGAFTNIGGVPAVRIARWNGSAWSGFGPGLSGSVQAVAKMPNGDVFASGGFLNTIGGTSGSLRRIARWDGAAWNAVGSGLNVGANVLRVLPSGELLAAGNFTTPFGSTQVLNRIARWDGTAWTPYGTGVDGAVFALTLMPDGGFVVGGFFANANGSPAAAVAQWGCPPVTEESCCRGTTCNSVTAGSCTGSVAGSASLVVGSCGAGLTIASCCYADFNHDGTLSIDDLFLYFNAYFTSSPWANVGGDGVEQPTIDDLFLYINAYFTGCI